MNFNQSSLLGMRPGDKREYQQMLSYGIDPGQLIGTAGDIYTAATQVPAGLMQKGITESIGNMPSWLGGGKGSAPLHRMAGSRNMTRLLRGGTALGAVGGVLGAADVLAGNDSLANKAMDATAMGIGGFLGMAGGPMGAAAGAGIGKTASDSLQWLFGDKKTAEQRQMEQALNTLNGGRY